MQITLALVGHEWYYLRYKEGDAFPKSVYLDDMECSVVIAKAYHVELQNLSENGSSDAQSDDPSFTSMYIPSLTTM